MKPSESPLTPDTLPRLLAAAQEPRRAFVVRFLWSTGVHPSVLCRDASQRAQDGPLFDYLGDEATMRWRRPKTKRFLSLSISAELARAADLWYAKDTPTRQTLGNWLREIGKASGVGLLNPRRLRHTAGAGLMASSRDPAVVKDTLGVSDEVLHTYIRLSDTDRRAKAAAWTKGGA